MLLNKEFGRVRFETENGLGPRTLWFLAVKSKFSYQSFYIELSTLKAQDEDL